MAFKTKQQKMFIWAKILMQKFISRSNFYFFIKGCYERPTFGHFIVRPKAWYFIATFNKEVKNASVNNINFLP